MGAGRGVRSAVVAGLLVLGAVIPNVAAGAAAPTKPGPPVITSVTPGPERIHIEVKAPAKNGGARIEGYRGVCEPVGGNGGATMERTSTQPRVDVPRLTPGKQYSCRVQARNVAGYGPLSQPSEVVKPTKFPTRGPAPPPTDVLAEAGSRLIVVRYSLSPDTVEQRVTGYHALCTATDKSHHNGQRGNSKGRITVNNLLPNKAYRCQVRTRNSSGWGAYSKPSNKVVTKA